MRMQYAWTHKLQLSGSTLYSLYYGLILFKNKIFQEIFAFSLATFRTVLLPILLTYSLVVKRGEWCFKINV